MTKQEFYKNFIKVQKETGQGLSGIVKVMGTDTVKFTQYLDELIKEGLVKACDTGNSIGHPETNIFYMPTKGYNVWEDEGIDGEYQRYKGRYLRYVRYYLGALPTEAPQDANLDENNKRNRKILNPTMDELSENKEFMKDYNEWLERNKSALEEMENLEDDYEKIKTK